MLLTPLFLSQNRKDTFHIPPNIKSINSKNYDIQERISNGGNAVVHKCVDTASGQEYAIKVSVKLCPPTTLKTTMR